MTEELTGTLEAAAFHGIATNVGYPMAERLACALQALDIYERETERTSALTGPPLDALVAWRAGFLQVAFNEAEQRALNELRTKTGLALEQAADWFIANGGAR